MRELAERIVAAVLNVDAWSAKRFYPIEVSRVVEILEAAKVAIPEEAPHAG